ncbi:5'(3')-deoxyribonucleotidase [Dyadobacter jejuensis]|uniref:5'(3')-deoxyribonucleotidase n=1 Tax=Dyadobacter jejuensis TaxID=1082580 RepID=A0A316AMX2_9BACT|nr:5'(3')-deoxyribonucleotidase [Dyadobacter jejuensis]PWJ58892.1 5'(3')-deoxyribonucleotidase [Dyadobacter jejuensis]
MIKLALDMDDVLANTHEKLVDIVLNEFKSNLTEADLHRAGLRELLHPKQYQRILKIMDSPGFFKDISVKEGAQETAHKLSQYYDIYIATACMEFPNSFQDKFNWLAHHFDFIPWTNLIFCGYKSILNTDYLIDDHPRNLAHFQGKGILFTAAHNRSETVYPRVNNWSEVGELFIPNK